MLSPELSIYSGPYFGCIAVTTLYSPLAIAMASLISTEWAILVMIEYIINATIINIQIFNQHKIHIID